MAEHKEKKKEELGLKRLRSSFPNTSKTPEYHCDNCGCNRYSPCKCQRKGDK